MVSSLFLLFLAFGFSKARQCGIPGSPTHGLFAPRQKVYDEGDRVTYRCQNGYYSKRDSQYVHTSSRSCQFHGIWDGDIPPCNYYDFLNETRLLIPSSRNQRYFVDGNDQTCGTLKFSSNRNTTDIVSTTIRFDTDEFVVRILLEKLNNIRDGANASILYRNRNIAENWIECANFSFLQDYDLILIACRPNQSLNAFQLKVVFTLVTRDPGIDTTISICSLQVLTRLPNVTCGSPDLPYHGNVTGNSSDVVYSCESGYSLRASKEATCKENNGSYQWHTEKAPICVSEREKDCKILPAIKNGRLTLVRSAGFEDYNFKESYPLASLQCDSGYTLRSENGISHCNEATNWTWQFNVRPNSFSVVTGDECISSIVTHDLKYWIIWTCTVSAAGAVLITLSIVFTCKKCHRQKNATQKTTEV